MTVLFADVERSMDMAAVLDIERLREVMTELVERSTAVLRRYGGTVEYNGDGVMALFGAPVALEDHAFRACLAALEVQGEASRLAAEVKQCDGIDFRVRVGLNSGRVIAGEIGSGAFGYRAIGETVGFAQRMESVAPAGGVMLSETTARLVEHHAVLAQPEPLRIKGADKPVRAFRLVSISARGGTAGRAEASLVGRRWELAALDATVDRALGSRGGVVNVVGPAGIGKSRVAREAEALATSRGVDVVWTFCDSHASEIPFHLVTQLLRAVIGVADLEGAPARARLRDRLPDADPQDLLLLDDLLGFADPEVPLPAIDPGARRRRLTAMINTASLARKTAALVIIEDVHWIDVVSESMVAEFLSVVPRTPLMVLITARPEYRGELSRISGEQSIVLAPLSDSDIAVLLGELLGSDSSLDEVAAIIVDRSHGNPFFAEEMVRELVQRGALRGELGDYVRYADVAELNVPATVQAAIESRIDRLGLPAKRTLTAAAVVGARFGEELLAALGVDPVFDQLLSAELIDQVRYKPTAEYAFRHPLVQAVAYESQLKSDRAQSHRRLAAAIQERAHGALEENAALIAEHLGAAGDLHAAYGWHMRAAAWSAKRDFSAARLSWERARGIADGLQADDPGHVAMRIAPRTMLCVTDFHAIRESSGRFAELRDLCTAAGDKVSIAIGMTGLATELFYSGRSREGAQLASEQMALLESINDSTLTVGLSFLAFVNWFDSGEFGELMRWSEIVIDLAEGDPSRGAGFGMGSPLAAALALRGAARCWLGRPGWRQDLQDGLAMAGNSDPGTRALLLGWTCVLEICWGVLRADDSVLNAVEEAVRTAEATSNDFGLGMAEYTLGAVLLYRDSAADRLRGLHMMAPTEDMWNDRGPHLLAVTKLLASRERVRRGDYDTPIPLMRQVVDELCDAGRIPLGVWGVGLLAEALVARGADADLSEAQLEIERLANLRGEHAAAMLEITILRLQALLAGARGDVSYGDLAGRYRAMAESLGFDGHIDWARDMIEAGH